MWDGGAQRHQLEKARSVERGGGGAEERRRREGEEEERGRGRGGGERERERRRREGEVGTKFCNGDNRGAVEGE